MSRWLANTGLINFIFVFYPDKKLISPLLIIKSGEFICTKDCTSWVPINIKALKFADYYNVRYLIKAILLAFSILLHAESML